MNKTTQSLYDHYKNTNKKLKIICDWDEVIQATESYAVWLSTNKEAAERFEIAGNDNLWKARQFPNYFMNYWITEPPFIEYSPYGSKNKIDKHLLDRPGYKERMERQNEYKNSPDFYQQAPFLTIAEDLLKLIKEDKIEQLIFLSTGDDRKKEVFKETFGKFYRIKTKAEIGDIKTEHDFQPLDAPCKISLKLLSEEMKTQPSIRTKADWIKQNASDFDIFIDDNPNICKSIIKKLSKMELLSEEDIAEYLEESNCGFCGEEVKREELGGFHHGSFDILGIWEPIHYKCWKKNWGAIDNNEQFYNDLNCYLGGLKITVLAPYYPAIANQHHPEVLLIKNEVSNLKKEDFNEIDMNKEKKEPCFRCIVKNYPGGCGVQFPCSDCVKKQEQ